MNCFFSFSIHLSIDHVRNHHDFIKLGIGKLQNLLGGFNIKSQNHGFLKNNPNSILFIDLSINKYRPIDKIRISLDLRTIIDTSSRDIVPETDENFQIDRYPNMIRYIKFPGEVQFKVTYI